MSKSKKKQDKNIGNQRKKLFFKNRLPNSTPRRTQKHLSKIDNPRITLIQPDQILFMIQIHLKFIFLKFLIKII